MTKHGLSLKQRILNGTYIDSNGCWIWRGAHLPEGYGMIRVGGKTLTTHSVSYTEWQGPIPAGLQIDHLCRVTVCCNPEHLEAVTCKENRRRRPN